jgi:hypothetical protein
MPPLLLLLLPPASTLASTLASSLASSSPTACLDDLYLACPKRAARGECEGAGAMPDPHAGARRMLAECRASCRARWPEDPLPQMVEKNGGLGDSVTDPFGFHYQLCGAGGFTAAGRDSLLFQIALNREQEEWAPAFTEVGFQKTRVPRGLWRRLEEDYRRVLPRMVRERCENEGSVINCQEIHESGGESFLRVVRRTFMMELGPEVLESVQKELQAAAEAWAGIRLEHTSTYGVRRYTNNSWLVAHMDRLGTHVISAIINVGQDVEEDWPLFIKDNSGGSHEVVLAPGEMLWYESARLPHGRMRHLKGSFFDNLFVHFRPAGEWYEGQYRIGARPWPREPATREGVARGQQGG